MVKQVVKIPVGLASRIVSERYKHGDKQKYETNRLIKLADLFIIIKSETTSGKIHCWRSKDAQGRWADLSKTSRRTVRNRIDQLEQLGLVSKIQDPNAKGWKYQHLQVCSWKRFLNELLIETKQINFYEIEISTDPESEKQSLEYVLRALEFHENKNKQRLAIQYAMQNNPEAFADLENLMLKHIPGLELNKLKDLDYFLSKLLWLQKVSFRHWKKLTTKGSKYAYQLIHKINACLDRSAKGIRRSHGYKSCLSTTYLKRQLKLRKLANLERITGLVSANRQRKGKTAFVSYDQSRKATVWHFPDQLKLQIPFVSQQTLENAA